MDIDQRWIFAAAAVIAGFGVGAILAGVARRLLGGPKRRVVLQAVAKPTSTFLFWLAVITGFVTAIGFASPGTLDPIPADLLAWLPKALVAGLILVSGYAGGSAIASAVSAAVERATKRRAVALEQSLRYGIMAAAVVLAVGNLGVQTTLLHILIAAGAASLGLSFALLSGLGGHRVAANIATGRTLRTELNIGDRIQINDISGTITRLRPAVAILETEQGETVLPLAMLLEQPFHITHREQAD